MYKRRKRKQAIANAADSFYEAPLGDAEAWSEQDRWGANYPGPAETFEPLAASYETFTYDPGNIRDQVDWAVGGVAGDTKTFIPLGVTDPKTVDAHDFEGMMQIVRRMPDTNYGPVKTSDHNSILQMLYAMQESSHFFPNEVSQADIIKAV